VSLSSVARGQCLDWLPGFEIPGHGVNNLVRDFLTWDDGSGETIYMAGGFDELGNGTRTSVARWTGTAWSPLGSDFNNTVETLTAFDDGSGTKLYAGGVFVDADGVAAQFLARWDGTAWSEAGGGLAGATWCSAVWDDGTGPALYIGGNFQVAGGLTANEIARWDGTTWSSLGTGMETSESSAWVRDLAVFDDGSGPALFACGRFETAGGIPARNFARWDGTSWSGFTTTMGVAALNMAVFDDGGGPDLYVTGDFSSIDGLPMGHIARWDGTSFSSIGDLGDWSAALHVHDDGTGPALYVGGDFWDVNSQSVSARSVARWDGTTWSGLGSGLRSSSNEPVRAMGSYNGPGGPLLFVGGNFYEAGEDPAENVSAWGIPCYSPVVLQDPVPQTAVFADPVVLTIDAIGTEHVTYQWRHDGVPIFDGDGIFGTDTDELTIDRWSYSNRGDYDCVVTNPLGSATSAAAMLEIPLPPTGVPIIVETVMYPPEPLPDLSGRTITDTCCSVQSPDERVLTRVNMDDGRNALVLIENASSEVLLELHTQAPVYNDPNILTDDQQPYSNWSIASNGQVTIAGQLDTGQGGVDTHNNQLIWFRDQTGWEVVAREDDSVPGVAAGTWDEIEKPRVSDSGHVTFWGQVYDNGTFVENGVWRWNRANGLVNIARSGDPAPGTPDSFSGFFSHAPIVDPAGRALFVAQTDLGQNGLWFGEPGNLALVVKVGDPAPGLAAGTTFRIVEYGRALSQNGTVFFGANAEESGGAWVNALYRWQAGTLTLMAAQNDPAPFPPGPVNYELFSFNVKAASPSGAVVFESNIANDCTVGGCITKGLFYDDGSGPVTIATNRVDPLPGMPTWSILSNFDFVGMNDLGHVAFGASGNFSAVFGWTAKQGLFPITVPGQQLQLSPGEYNTVGGGGISGTDGGESGGQSTSLTPGGGLVFSIGFFDFENTTGIFRGLFDAIAATYSPCAAIVVQPSSTSTLLGLPTTFEVIAGGQAPLTYQWYHNGLALSDDTRISGSMTSELTIDPVEVEDAGNYTVLVSNGCGSETSEIALLNSGFGGTFCDATDGALASCPCGNAGSPNTGCDIQQGTGGVSLTTIHQQTTPINRVTTQGAGFPAASSPTAIALRASSLEAAPVAFGDGLRCTGVPVVRLAATFANGGVSTHTFGHGAMAGTGSFHYQLWFRNTPAMFCTPSAFNLSSGRSLMW
jgi:hypothetical protein